MPAASPPRVRPPVWQLCLGACCLALIACAGWQHAGSMAAAPATAALSSTQLRESSAAAARRHSYAASTALPPVVERNDADYPYYPRRASDEGVFEEQHQQGLQRMYSAGGEATGAPEPITPDSDNPYSFPGMTPNEGPDEWDYALTIDCGSKGSRLHIYKWQHRHSSSSIPPFSPLFTKHAWSQKVTPGISSFASDPEMVLKSLKLLLEFARNSLSEYKWKWNRTPVYLKATAGMRLVKNLPSRDRIMETIRTFLSDHTQNPFYFERTMARVISGEEEGVYGWITANYLSGTLMHASSATSFGTLDMGGASTQITFRPPFDVLSNYFPLRLQQEKIRLYTHSFLNFGIDLALQRVNARLIELGNVTGQVNFFKGIRDGVQVYSHPCFPLGFSFTYEYVSNTDLGASYSGQRTDAVGLGGDDANGADLSPITTWTDANAAREMVQFEGSQDFLNCSEITWQLLHKKAPCFDNTCSFDGIYQPRFGNVTFLAFSEFSKVVLDDLSLSHNASLAQIDRRTRELCQFNWQKLQDTFRYAKIDSLSKLCFNARYIFTVLYKGFGFPYEGSNLLFIKSILDLDLTWALGSTLYEANAMPWDIDLRVRGGEEEAFRYRLGDDGGGGATGSSSDPHSDRDDSTPPSQRDRTDMGMGAKGHDELDRVSHHADSHDPEEDQHEHKHDKRPRKRHEAREAHGKREQRHDKRQSEKEKREEHEQRKKWIRSQQPKAVDHRKASSEADAHSTQPAGEFGRSDQSTDSEFLPNPHSHHGVAPRPVASSPAPESEPAPAPSMLTEAHLWTAVGFLFGGWLVTSAAFFFCLRQARSEVRRMEERGLRYEPIHDGGLP